MATLLRDMPRRSTSGAEIVMSDRATEALRLLRESSHLVTPRKGSKAEAAVGRNELGVGGQAALVEQGRPPTIEYTLPFRPLSAVIEGMPSELPWRVDGFLADGCVTLLAGKPKVGKTMFITATIAALSEGREIAGLATRQTQVLLLTEEGPTALRPKADRWLIDPLVVARSDVRYENWSEIVTQAVGKCVEERCGLLVVDTLSAWTGLSGELENSSGAANEALSLLSHAAINHRIAVLLTHHVRKGSLGADGDTDAFRGSSAITAVVDLVATLDYVPNGLANERKLHCRGRICDPWTRTIALTDQGYEDRGDQSHDGLLIAYLQEHGPMTRTDIQAALGGETRTINDRLKRLYGSGQLQREGESHAGYLYSIEAGG